MKQTAVKPPKGPDEAIDRLLAAKRPIVVSYHPDFSPPVGAVLRQYGGRFLNRYQLRVIRRAHKREFTELFRFLFPTKPLSAKRWDYVLCEAGPIEPNKGDAA